jgi:hypothetical protein
MTTAATNRRYRSTESKYKGGAQEMYVTYDLEQKTRGGQSDLYYKVKWAYIAREGRGWRAGLVRKKTGREVHGPAGRDEISRGAKDCRCDCSAVCSGGRGSDALPLCAFLF